MGARGCRWSETLGRIATRIAHVLLGKHKPTFTPGVEMGDYVVVINAEKVTVTGTKTSTKMDTKMYHRHSIIPAATKPSPCVISWINIPTVCCMPQYGACCRTTAWDAALLKRLKIYAGPNHPHGTNHPEPLA